MNYTEALAYLKQKGRFGIKPGLERIELLLGKMGNPQNDIPSYVHVSGTNGKGSVTSMLTSIFQAAGLKAGKFISPHLEKWNERINIGGQDVTDRQFAEAISYVKPFVEEITEEDLMPTQFEIITAAAFWLFKKAALEIVVLEVGMGGLYDSTNVVIPECSIITNVGIDHTQYFGDKLETIAREKAGIIKQSIPVVTAAESVALNVLIDQAAPLHADIYAFRLDFTAINLGGSISEQQFLFKKGDFSCMFTVSLGGDHQVVNAALAVMATKILSDRHPQLTVAAMQNGLSQVKWPGRLELIRQAPDIILDGAHNVNSAEVLRAALDKYYPNKSICFVIGMMKDKDIKGVVQALIHKTDIVLAVAADDSERAASPEQIAALHEGKSFACDDLPTAIDKAVQLAGADGIVCIAGSLYLAGQVKSNWTK